MKKVLLVVCFCLPLCGCPFTKNGVEIGGKLGIYGVDERQESQKMHAKPMPLKCYFVSCDPVVEGS
jgi:hypothetical protein